jgi:cell division protein DivIC
MKNPLKDNYWYKFLSNKYVWVSLSFLVWMVFLDNYSYFEHRFLNKQIDGLEENIKQLKNPMQIEKYAREKYYMKKDSEDIYIIQFDGDTVKKK